MGVGGRHGKYAALDFKENAVEHRIILFHGGCVSNETIELLQICAGHMTYIDPFHFLYLREVIIRHSREPVMCASCTEMA